jgi:hypothetical protein
MPKIGHFSFYLPPAGSRDLHAGEAIRPLKARAFLGEPRTPVPASVTAVLDGAILLSGTQPVKRDWVPIASKIEIAPRHKVLPPIVRTWIGPGPTHPGRRDERRLTRNTSAPLAPARVHPSVKMPSRHAVPDRVVDQRRMPLTAGNHVTETGRDNTKANRPAAPKIRRDNARLLARETGGYSANLLAGGSRKAQFV